MKKEINETIQRIETAKKKTDNEGLKVAIQEKTKVLTGNKTVTK